MRASCWWRTIPTIFWSSRGPSGTLPIRLELKVCEDGREAFDYLDQGAADENAPPDLIVLDLNMPVVDGTTFLHKLRAHGRLHSVPVCVLTTAMDEEAIRRAYESGANAVVSKVDTLEGMSAILNTIVEFCFSTARRYYLD
ncbi:response regulator [Breoghania sp.]|uniref:response regulator n=1 Tax=Breoghania sp. TaxID=2065378 RepID=UPI00262CE740|nr:response regulator [Breoghania sp.]MDJ0932484.1 response regulator [Breoghania sp.]